MGLDDIVDSVAEDITDAIKRGVDAAKGAVGVGVEFTWETILPNLPGVLAVRLQKEGLSALTTVDPLSWMATQWRNASAQGAQQPKGKQAQLKAAIQKAETPEEMAAILERGLTDIEQSLTAAASPYSVALQSFSRFPTPTSTRRLGLSPELLKVPGLAPQADYVEEPTGKILYPNGVIADPSNGQVLFPPGDPAVAGSEPWLAMAQANWDEKKVEAWRKQLAKQGYEVVRSGGWAMDVIVALRDYHRNRYLNFGNAQPLIPTTQKAREEIRKSTDFVALKEEIKGWGQVPFEEQLDPNTAEYFADRVMDVATRLARTKGWTPEQAVAGAQLRVQKEFVETPGVKGALREAEEDEMDESLRDTIVSISQIAAT